LTSGLGRDDLILRHDDGSPWGPGHQFRRIADTCARAKINPPINFHLLRHTYASLAIGNGVPLMVVAKNLGHRDTKMVEKHYGHLAPSYVADEIRKGAPTFGIEPETDVVSIDERRTKGTTS
jgi:integrase